MGHHILLLLLLHFRLGPADSVVPGSDPLPQAECVAVSPCPAGQTQQSWKGPNLAVHPGAPLKEEEKQEEEGGGEGKEGKGEPRGEPSQEVSQ